jgi:hypothetical protein
MVCHEIIGERLRGLRLKRICLRYPRNSYRTVVCLSNLDNQYEQLV